MANPPKQKGTGYETEIARLADARPRLVGRRAENNAPGRDVEIKLSDGTVVPVECKNRAQLNVHKLAAEVEKKQPGQPPIIIWRRTQKKDGNVRATRDGPDVAAIPVPMLLDILEIVSAVRDPLATFNSEIVTCLADQLTDRYPNLGL